MKYESLKSEPKKKRKPKSPKDKAWDAFSIYIRTRDCIRFSGDPALGKCVTCKRAYPFKKLQAGHFIQGRSNSVLFDERIVYSQCIGCNGNPPYGKGGNYVEYYVFMLEEWGQIMIDEFRAQKYKTVKYKNFEYEQMEQEFKQKTQDLLDRYNKKWYDCTNPWEKANRSLGFSL